MGPDIAQQKGGVPCETSPNACRISKIRLGDRITNSGVTDEVVHSSSARVSRPLPVKPLLYEFSSCHSRQSFPILLKAIDYSLLLEDFSSVNSLEAQSGTKFVRFRKITDSSFHIVGSDGSGLALLGFREPTATEFFRRDAGHVGLDVEDRRAVEHIHAAHA